ncbi:hypothetical protein GE061_014799 [Apolygus lucorum]|uniref:Uncharacterized protein n=1 Tax=Apolygus lucorum TaxID=248454 RepID=A0A8S9XLZ5_APOLU|nr:hypothetical protein GE061_014799 [Apolygus lucorum]
MIQIIHRLCLVCSITLITLGNAVELLKSSEFEDKEIPFLLNWKGEKYEKNQNIDGNWWRWVQEANEKTITEETNRNQAHRNGRTFVFKRSVEPFRPNIYPLRTLFSSDVRQNRPNQKRWIPTSFGFGNKKKSRKDSKQSSVGVQKTVVAHTTPSSDVSQEPCDLRGRIKPVPQNHQDAHNTRTFQADKAVNSSIKTGISGTNFGQPLDIARLSKDKIPKYKPNPIFRTHVFENIPLDDGMNRKFQYDRQFKTQKTLDRNHDLKMSSIHPAYDFATAGQTYGDLLSTRKLSVDPRFWAKYTTETIFERIFVPYTELRAVPDKYRYPFNEFPVTSNQNTSVTPYGVPDEPGTIESQPIAPVRLREHLTSQKYPDKDFSFNANDDDSEEAEIFSTPEKQAKAPNSNRNLDVFDQISIPSVKNTYSSVKNQQMDKTMKCHRGMNNENKNRHKYGEVINSVVPAVKTRNNMMRKPIVIADEGTNYDMPLEEDDQCENNSIALSPAMLPRKSNKSQNRNTTALRPPIQDSGKGCNNVCGNGNCGNCGGGVNISILMPSLPGYGSTVDHTAAQTHSTASSSLGDKIKKKKERNKKVNKNPDNMMSVIFGRSDELIGNPSKKISACRGNNDSLFNLFSPPSERRLPYKFKQLQDSNDGIKTQYREVMAASGRSFESTKHDPLNFHGDNFSSWKYLDIVHQLHQSIPPTIFGLQTVGGSSDDMDDEDELKDLYDEQNSTKTEALMKPPTLPSYGQTILPDYAKHLLYAKDPPHSAIEKIGVLEKLKNNNSVVRLSGQGKDIKFPSLIKKNKEIPPKRGRHFDDLYDLWEKYSFPDQSSAHSFVHEIKKSYAGARTTVSHNQIPRIQSYKRQRQQVYRQPKEEAQGSDYYDQWEALDRDLKNVLTGDSRENLNIMKVRNKKREVDCEDSVNDAQGFYRLSSGISLRNPGNMIISAIRQGKMNHDRRRPYMYEEDPVRDLPEPNPVTAKPNPATNTS